MASLKAIDNKVVLYIPAYNCARQIEQVLDEVPDSLLPTLSVLVVDNCSTDGTAQKVVDWASRNNDKCRVTVIRPHANLGYSGSQKLAYSILTLPEIAGAVKKVVMLHGDGQYPPMFLKDLSNFFDSPESIVYGYRSKTVYGSKEETPWPTYAFIKTLSAVESVITGVSRKEWHSGFVMYDTAFLRKVRFASLTDTPHIDGHLQFVAGLLRLPVKAIPIFKRYKDYEAFGGTGRIYYVLRVLGLMAGFRFSRNEVLQDPAAPTHAFADYEVIYQTA